MPVTIVSRNGTVYYSIATACLNFPAWMRGMGGGGGGGEERGRGWGSGGWGKQVWGPWLRGEGCGWGKVKVYPPPLSPSILLLSISTTTHCALLYTLLTLSLSRFPMYCTLLIIRDCVHG